MRYVPTIMAVLLSTSALIADESKVVRWDFEDTKSGSLPAGWVATKTGDGEGSVWKVVEDKSAPAGPRVLAQVAAGPGPLFNLCIADASAFRDLELSVAFQAVKGKIDQGGGVVWRYTDAGNYYIARFNPLESNFRVYKVVDGKRTQLATKESLQAPAGKWHTLSIKMQGDKIECSLNGKPQLDATDDAFAKRGKVGLWTKADAHTFFDQLEAKSLD